MTMDQKIDDILKIIREQGDRYDLQFAQMNVGFVELKASLETKIDKFYDSLSQDIQAFAGDLYKFEKRLPHPKKKSLS